MEEPITVAFEFEKSTKNTYRYKEISVGGMTNRPKVVGTLYIQKSAFASHVLGTQPPARISVTLMVGEK